MTINRREFVHQLAETACAVSAFGPSLIAESPSARKLNIVFVLVDDLGWGDFSCYGDTYHETPNIDQLAREGMKFTAAYAAAPVCSPSRGAIMTGQAPARTHLTEWIPGSEFPRKKLLPGDFLQKLPDSIPTIASELKKLGYFTGAIGKWHLGGPGALPENFGFDRNVAGDMHGHPAPPNGFFGPFAYHNLTGYTSNDNLTEVLSDKVDEFLEEAVTKGLFFLYLAEYAVHEPLAERKERIAKYRGKNPQRDELDATYAAVVESVDTAVGRLRKKLAQLGVARDTVIILTSDNGGVRYAEDGFTKNILHKIANNGPFHGGKGFLYEGGIREPLIVHWPGVTKPASVSDVPVYGADFMPTILAAAGKSAPMTLRDGVDISPILHGKGAAERDHICWHYPHYSPQGGTPAGAIRQGEWKLIEFFEDGHLELYNLVQDPGEQYDFASIYPERANALQVTLATWRENMGAAMPKPNPNYDPTRLAEHRGPKICSPLVTQGCTED